ncbi:FAM174B isoform 2 [Pongo abelii]|uniref:Family with sequence similarity 174 member B n=2 Tax=Hominidae TaxID=9604 RepID=H3BTJ4_HUMAN|nr:FAM174B isoform 2 [Pongo abelii]
MKRMMKMRTPQYSTSNTGLSGDSREPGHLAAVRPLNL